jgi:hypothetical protein
MQPPRNIDKAELEKQLKDAYEEGGKFAAIKAYRELTGCDLLTSFNKVNELEAALLFADKPTS